VTSIPIPSLGHLPDEAKALLRNWGAYQFELPQEQAILQMLEGVPDAASYFLDAEWLLLRFDGYPLLTTDEPLALARDKDPAPFALGLSNADSILFPLSPSYCLAMMRVGGLGREAVVPAPARLAKEINGIVFSNTWWHQAYRHPEGPPFPTPRALPKRRVVAPPFIGEAGSD
jgi:hypothetical protein